MVNNMRVLITLIEVSTGLEHTLVHYILDVSVHDYGLAG